MLSNQKDLRSHTSWYVLASMLFIVVMMGILSACGSNATSSPQGSSGTRKVVPSPNAGLALSLRGVTALSARDIWAVGSSYSSSSGGGQTLIEHWNGSSWSVVKSPNPGSDLNELSGVAAVSVSNIWAVGDSYSSRSNGRQTLIEHWNGSKWSIVPGPTNPGVVSSELSGVTALSARDVWAVGFSSSDPYSNPYKRQALIEHYSYNK